MNPVRSAALALATLLSCVACGGPPGVSPVAGHWVSHGDDFTIDMTLEGHVGGPITGSGTYIVPFDVVGTETEITWVSRNGSSALIFRYVKADARTLTLRVTSAENAGGFDFLRQ